jgi:NAD(P)-dependent dehydrogenase (short-subunit alcohol dehydrogenase family)
MAKKPVCVVVGIGPGNGAALARRFAREGNAVALLSRSTDTSSALAAEIGKDSARAYACDAGDPSSVSRVFAEIEKDLGAPSIVVYNAGSGAWGSVEEISLEDFESAWRVNALGLLATTKAVVPAMKSAGSGAIIVIGATASRRGAPKTAIFAPAKAAQRSLCESMAKSLGPAGIHVALIIVDGVIDIPKTRAAMADKPDSFFLRPDDIADLAAYLAKQPRSAWTFEAEARPFAEKW